MGNSVGRILCICFAMLAFAGTAQAKTTSWATPQIRAVTAAGLMGAKDVASFRADDALTAQSLETLVYDLKARTAQPVEPPIAAPFPLPPMTDPTVTLPATTTTTTTTTATITT